MSEEDLVSGAHTINTGASRTSRVWVDLPVAVEWSAAGEQIEDHSQVADDHQSVADVNANLIVPAQTCLSQGSAAVHLRCVGFPYA